MRAQGKIPSLSVVEELILGMLLREGSMFGLQMVEASKGQLKRGTIYVTLDRMVAKGLLTCSKEQRPEGDCGIPLKLCHISDYGKKLFEALQVVREHMTNHTGQGAS